MAQYTIEPPDTPAGGKSKYTIEPPAAAPKPPTFPEEMREAVRDEPGVTYGEFLPISHSEKGGYGLALPESLRDLVRGTADLLEGGHGGLEPGQDISPEAKGALIAMETGGLRRPGVVKYSPTEAAEATGETVTKPMVPMQRPEAPPKVTLVSGLTAPFRQGLQYIWSIDREKLAKAAELGEAVAPSSYAPGFVRGQRWVDLSRLLQTDPLKKGSHRVAERGMQEAFEHTGMTPEQAAAERTRLSKVEAPNVEGAGLYIKAAATVEQQTKIDTLKSQIADIRQKAVERGHFDIDRIEGDMAALRQGIQDADREVNQRISNSWDKVKQIRDVGDPQGLAQFTEGKIRDIRKDVIDHAETRYNLADLVAGNEKASTVAGRTAVKDFKESLPEEFNLPILQKLLDEFSSGEMSFGRLHYLRSFLRDLGYIDNDKLTPTFKRGPYKWLSGVVDQIIHDTGNTENFQLASKFLDSADNWYSTEMARFRDPVIQHLTDLTKAGLPPDPTKVSRLIVQGGEQESARLGEILNIVGDEGRLKIRAADYDDMINSSLRPLSQEVDPNELLKEVDHRFQNGTLQQLWGDKESKEIVRLTERLAAKSGDLPLESLHHDDIVTFLRQANLYRNELESLAKKDPAKMMDAAIKGGQKLAKEATQTFKEGQRQDILASFANPQLMATTAAEQLLEPSNLPRLREAMIRWRGTPDGDEAIRRLQLVALDKVLAPLARKEDPVEVLHTLQGMPHDQQELLFPGGLADDIKTLAGQLRLIYGSSVRAVPGFATGAILDKDIKGFLKSLIPITFRSYVVTHPRFVQMLAGLMNAGDRYKQIGRASLMEQLARWTLQGEMGQQGWEGDQDRSVIPPPPPEVDTDWRKLLQPSKPRDWQYMIGEHGKVQ